MRIALLPAFLLLPLIAFGQYKPGDTINSILDYRVQLVEEANASSVWMEEGIWNDTLWDFSAYDSNAVFQSIFYSDFDSELSIGTNLLECRNGGEVVRYWNASDTALLLRAHINKMPLSRSCEEDIYNTFYGALFGNSEYVPLPNAPLFFEDDYDFDRISHVSGFPLDVFESGFATRPQRFARGEKSIIQRKIGTLITPVDTLSGCTMIIEKGVLREFERYNLTLLEEYSLLNAYCYHPDYSTPILMLSQWTRGQVDSDGYKIITNVEMRKTNVAAKRLALQTQLNPKCNVYPNPSLEACINHNFDLVEGVEVYNLVGSEVPFNISENEICCENAAAQVVFVRGRCAGNFRTQKVIFGVK